jgi:UDP-N-acetylmuramoyl-L-alanyl-D-glutamate--2,6-diaminopimelate ligase
MTTDLASLLAGVEVTEVVGGDPARVTVTGVTQDSSSVIAGSLYCCVRGRSVDGHDLAGAVVAAGAGSLLVERVVDVAVPQVRVPSTREAIAPVAAAFWGHPSASLTVIGVTGTNGKTTTTHLLAGIVRAAGHQAGVIGTLTGVRTTPEAAVLQARLADHRDQGFDTVAMEVSSMALDQHRADAIDFAAAVWTNLSQDHLDYHGDMEAYFAAKALLFEAGRSRLAVVNRDDAYGRRLLNAISIPAATYGLEDAEGLDLEPKVSRFTWRGQAVVLPMGGAHNVANALAAATTAEALGIDPATVAAGLNDPAPVPGRWEPVDAGQPFTVVVDYAHTPDALERVLRAARQGLTNGGRVITVFGCGGDRDRTKRPLMGAAATRLADIAVLTSDNPRSEDPEAIIAEVAAGADPAGRLLIEPDRERAIAIALDLARSGDVVLLAGKGHERGQTIGDLVLPFDDHEVATRLLTERQT